MMRKIVFFFDAKLVKINNNKREGKTAKNVKNIKSLKFKGLGIPRLRFILILISLAHIHNISFSSLFTNGPKQLVFVPGKPFKPSLQGPFISFK